MKAHGYPATDSRTNKLVPKEMLENPVLYPAAEALAPLEFGAAHIKDVSPALAATVRGEETGIGSSEVFVGGGVNAENIRKCLVYLQQTGWDGVVSIECSGTDENTRKSVEWMKGVVKGLKKK